MSTQNKKNPLPLSNRFFIISDAINRIPSCWLVVWDYLFYYFCNSLKINSSNCFTSGKVSIYVETNKLLSIPANAYSTIFLPLRVHNKIPTGHYFSDMRKREFVYNITSIIYKLMRWRSIFSRKVRRRRTNSICQILFYMRI